MTAEIWLATGQIFFGEQRTAQKSAVVHCAEILTYNLGERTSFWLPPLPATAGQTKDMKKTPQAQPMAHFPTHEQS